MRVTMHAITNTFIASVDCLTYCCFTWPVNNKCFDEIHRSEKPPLPWGQGFTATSTWFGFLQTAVLRSQGYCPDLNVLNSKV